MGSGISLNNQQLIEIFKNNFKLNINNMNEELSLKEKKIYEELIYFLHQRKFKTPIRHRLGVKIWL